MLPMLARQTVRQGPRPLFRNVQGADQRAHQIRLGNDAHELLAGVNDSAVALQPPARDAT
jgi:hypothetical protein